MSDVEMNEVKVALLDNEQSKDNNGDVIPEVIIKTPNSTESFTGLTKEELEKLAQDPFWKRVRLISFIVFWLIWLSMLVAAILIVVLSPKCPVKEKLEFWELKTGYWVDTMAFADSDNNNIGDFNGLSSKLDYIQKVVGAGYIILENIFSGQYTNNENIIGIVNSFKDIDSILGNEESFKKLIKNTRKRGLEVVLAADFNSLFQYSSFISNSSEKFMNWTKEMQDWKSRDGMPVRRNLSNQIFYSSSPVNSNMIDLDLTNQFVVNEIKKSVKMWLKLGVRGFLLTNIAFYVENVTLDSKSVPYNLNQSDWYKNQSFYSQVFCNDTLKFLKEIRTVMNEVAKKTDRSRLLMVEAGNVGYGLTDNTDDMLQYLDGEEKIVDMVVSREFLRTRGWTIYTNYSKSLVSNYLSMTENISRKRVALMSATSTSIRTTQLRKVAAPFLLPGNPIIYYGSEIGTECDRNITIRNMTTFYPKNHKFLLEDNSFEDLIKCNHMVMAWDNIGTGFNKGNGSNARDFLKNVRNTVQGLTAIGRGETILQLHQKLIKIRVEPSLQWGTIKIFFQQTTNQGIYEIFIREAPGFPKIIVALIEDNIEGKVFALSSICAKVLPILVYPENKNLPENKEVDADNIYLKIGRESSVHVFKCVP